MGSILAKVSDATEQLVSTVHALLMAQALAAIHTPD
jgi:hypothetical protein